MAHVRRKVRFNTQDNKIIDWFLGKDISDYDDGWLEFVLMLNETDRSRGENTVETWRRLKDQILLTMRLDSKLTLRYDQAFICDMPDDYFKLLNVTRSQILKARLAELDELKQKHIKH